MTAAVIKHDVNHFSRENTEERQTLIFTVAFFFVCVFDKQTICNGKNKGLALLMILTMKISFTVRIIRALKEALKEASKETVKEALTEASKEG